MASLLPEDIGRMHKRRGTISLLGTPSFIFSSLPGINLINCRNKYSQIYSFCMQNQSASNKTKFHESFIGSVSSEDLIGII
jgi:hypothetical protein